MKGNNLKRKGREDEEFLGGLKEEYLGSHCMLQAASLPDKSNHLWTGPHLSATSFTIAVFVQNSRFYDGSLNQL